MFSYAHLFQYLPNLAAAFVTKVSVDIRRLYPYHLNFDICSETYDDIQGTISVSYSVVSSGKTKIPLVQNDVSLGQ